MPMLFVGADAHHITGFDLLDGAAPALMESASERDDERLSEGMGVPIAASAGLERHVRPTNPPGSARLEQRIEADRPGEMLGWGLLRRPRAASGGAHGILLGWVV
jgi:hypothetical protein